MVAGYIEVIVYYSVYYIIATKHLPRAVPYRVTAHARHAQEPGSRSVVFTDRERPFDAGSLPASSSWTPSVFTLATLAGRFAPAIVDPSELRERAGARVRVVTPVGLRVGLVRRVFAREPLLPSDVEAEEEQQVS